MNSCTKSRCPMCGGSISILEVFCDPCLHSYFGKPARGLLQKIRDCGLCTMPVFMPKFDASYFPNASCPPSKDVRKRIDDAKRICSVCPALMACKRLLPHSYSSAERFGMVIAGMDAFEQRERLKRIIRNRCMANHPSGYGRGANR